jgi:hypothetical protein
MRDPPPAANLAANPTVVETAQPHCWDKVPAVTGKSVAEVPPAITMLPCASSARAVAFVMPNVPRQPLPPVQVAVFPPK